MSETQQISKLGMPKWGLSMTEGTIVEWLIDEGTELGKGDEVVEVESKKRVGRARAEGRQPGARW